MQQDWNRRDGLHIGGTYHSQPHGLLKIQLVAKTVVLRKEEAQQGTSRKLSSLRRVT